MKSLTKELENADGCSLEETLASIDEEPDFSQPVRGLISYFLHQITFDELLLLERIYNNLEVLGYLLKINHTTHPDKRYMLTASSWSQFDNLTTFDNFVASKLEIPNPDTIGYIDKGKISKEVYYSEQKTAH